MMMGPDPMTRIEEMSVRFGILRVAARSIAVGSLFVIRHSASQMEPRTTTTNNEQRITNNTMQRLVQGDGFEVRLSGERAQAVAREEIRKRGLALDQLDMEFRAGEIRVKARLRAAFPVPFSFVIRKIQAAERTIRLFVEDMSAFGFLPVPAILSRLAGDRQAAEGVRFDAASNSVFIQLDRFANVHE